MKVETKYTFEESDFAGSGQIIISRSAPIESNDFIYKLTVTYKVGYMYPENGLDTLYCLISMCDGMVIRTFESKAVLVSYINNDKVGFRPIEKQELLDIMKVEYNRFRK